MAEFIMKHLVKQSGLENDFLIDSMATSTEEIGNGPHYGTVEKLRQEGIPVLRHYAQQMKKSDYEKYDMIIGMDGMNYRNIMRIIGSDPENKVSLLLEHAGSSRDIADPWYTGNFDQTFDDVLEGCEALLKELKG